MNPIDRIAEFCSLVSKLENSRYFTNGLRGALLLSMPPEPPWAMVDFDEEEFTAFINTFRRVTLKNDRCHLPDVYRDALIVYGGTKRERWIHKSELRTKRLQTNGWPSTFEVPGGNSEPLELFKLWLYGELLHRNMGDKHVERWDSLPDFGKDLVKGAALQFVTGMVRELSHLRKLLRTDQSSREQHGD